MKKLLFLVLLVAGWKLYQVNTEQHVEDLFPTTTISQALFEKEQRFSCDGRQHCSQMTSRAEAEFFTRNCPNTKMDGDHDGIPCERDTRF